MAAVLLAACLAGAAVRPADAAGEKAVANEDKPGDAAPDVSKASIEGVVVDEEGKPVAGAVVEVIAFDPARVSDRTAADGSFRLILDATAVRNEVVLASAEDGKRQGIHEFGDDSSPPTAQVRIVLKPSRKMTVRVTDAAKKPVRDAAVGVLENWKLLAHAETDADGAVSLRFPSDARVTDVVALKPQAGLDYFENFNAALPSKVVEPPAAVALTLDGAKTLSVRAVDSADKPLPGVELAPWHVWKKGKQYSVDLPKGIKYAFARTDRDGLAAFEWVPPDLKVGIRILYVGKEYSLPDAPYQDPKLPYQTLTAKLFRRTLIRGKVILPSGKPAAGVLLYARGEGMTTFIFSDQVRTQADGSYSFPAYANQCYAISVIDNDWVAPSLTGIVVKECRTARCA